MKTNSQAGLRTYLRANMFDGDEGGTATMPIGLLLDEVCQHVAMWIMDETGTYDFMEDYFTEPATVNIVTDHFAENCVDSDCPAHGTSGREEAVTDGD